VREQHSIEGTFVQWRETVDGSSVLSGNRQLGVVVLDKASPNEPRVYFEILATESTLDRYFSDADETEKQRVTWILEEIAGVRTSRWPRRASRPQAVYRGAASAFPFE
jgi:hypothetical protein